MKRKVEISNNFNAVKIKPEKDFEIILDQDDFLNYETKRWLSRISLLLIMWILTAWVIFKKKILGIKPKINTFWFDGLSSPCRLVKEGAGSWRALDLIYNYKFGQENGIKCKVSDYWFRIINAQAVRNRLRLVRRK